MGKKKPPRNARMRLKKEKKSTKSPEVREIKR